MNLQGDVFRDVAGRRTLRFNLGKASFFIKIHQGVGWLEIFKNLTQVKLPVLGASNEYRAIRKLEQLGVKTMTIAGFGERGLNPAKKQSFIITEELQNTISLEDFCVNWAKQKPDYILKMGLIKKVAKIARCLHQNGVNHRDFYLCHFLLQQEDLVAGHVNLYLIDLHRAQIRRKTPRRWLLKDLAGLYFSAMDIGLSKKDIFRFLKHYKGVSLAVILNDKYFWSAVTRKAKKLYQSSVS